MASPVDTSVKHAYSSMTGAPAIGGTAGSLIGALDAFLVNGWGAKAVDSAVISNGTCRLSFASGKSAAEAHAVIVVAGATPSALNGEQKVTAVANGWVEFKTDLPDGAVTGSISFKMAPLGWEKVFTGTNKAVYRQTDPASTRTYYRIDDSNALYARVQMYESMTDVDNGTAAAPLTVAGGYYWYKRGSGTAATYWVLAGDSRGFYAFLYPNSSSVATNANVAGSSYYAGDLNSYRSGDAWCGVLTGLYSQSLNTAGCVFASSSSDGLSIKRMSHGIGGAVQTVRRCLGNISAASGADGSLGPFPSVVDNSLRLSPILLMDASNSFSPRGEMPGAYHCPQSGVLAVMGWDVLITKGQGQLSGKQLLSTHVGPPGSASQGLAFLDVSSPWRV
ncbi:hypothetical protein Cthiooxydans_15500 [Comamonas thiooxydans]|uniref:hypothetical protein n=1 Tax=Comamonas thiooxydans TaxID=363952 RepID=UPI001E5277F0|nr:hypothetical protein [Comamonas thiooxydans]BDB69138.1 hypothetical protein Cthiooxydans_15500 [Comamonas thiooxydans]